MLTWNSRRSQQCGGRDRERWTGLLWRAPSARAQVISSVLQGLVHPEGLESGSWDYLWCQIVQLGPGDDCSEKWQQLWLWALWVLWWWARLSFLSSASSKDRAHLGKGNTAIASSMSRRGAGSAVLIFGRFGAGRVTGGCSEAVGSGQGEAAKLSQLGCDLLQGLGHPSSASCSFSKLWPVC